MIKIHVVPGWAEGNWQFKQLVRNSSEFRLEREAAKADVIFAHSSGVYSLPQIKSHHLVLIVDPPYWPGRSLASCVYQNVITDLPLQLKNFGLSFELRLRFWNIIYLIIEPWRHIKLWRSLKKTFELANKGKGVAVIRDSRDAYCGLAIKELVNKYPGIRYFEIDGLHESCWHNPEPYLKVIKTLQGVK